MKQYDPLHKGLMEILANEEGLKCGFNVHWPNNSESTYRRSDCGIEMVNCKLDMSNSTIELMAGLYARKPGGFSPLVELGEEAAYTPLDQSGEIPTWE